MQSHGRPLTLRHGGPLVDPYDPRGTGCACAVVGGRARLPGRACCRRLLVSPWVVSAVVQVQVHKLWTSWAACGYGVVRWCGGAVGGLIGTFWAGRHSRVL